jgi:predicted peroxiredoxin
MVRRALGRFANKWLWVALFVPAMLLGGAASAIDPPPRDGVLIHISHGADDPHRALMALNMASMMSEERDVLVYFDIKAVEMVLNDAEELSYADFPSSKRQLSTLRERGVALVVCPGCLKAAGKSPDDLAEGIVVADKSVFFSFTEGRILTLDY